MNEVVDDTSYRKSMASVSICEMLHSSHFLHLIFSPIALAFSFLSQKMKGELKGAVSLSQIVRPGRRPLVVQVGSKVVSP